MQRRTDDEVTAGAPAGRGPKRLLLSIHDVCPRHEGPTDRLRDLLLARGGSRMAMLVVPDFWQESPIVRGSAFAARLRSWSEAGVEIFLHGHVHRHETDHASAIARFQARHLTAGEGEFLGLSRSEATSRIESGRRLLEDVTGAPIAGFVAPAWLYGRHSRSALADAGVGMAEDHWRVWNPTTGAVLARSPVLTWATRSRLCMRSSLAMAAVARMLPTFRVVRLRVHPGNCGEPEVVSSIKETICALRRVRAVSRYADLEREAVCAS